MSPLVCFYLVASVLSAWAFLAMLSGERAQRVQDIELAIAQAEAEAARLAAEAEAARERKSAR